MKPALTAFTEQRFAEYKEIDAGRCFQTIKTDVEVKPGVEGKRWEGGEIRMAEQT